MTRRVQFSFLLAFIMLIAIAVPMTVTYTTAYRIDDLEQRQAKLRAAIKSEQNAIRVLQAEWAYLAEPARVERLAASFLKMEKAGTTQLALARDLAEETVAPVAVAAAPAAAPAPVQLADAEIEKSMVVAATVKRAAEQAKAGNTPDDVRLLLASFQQ